MSDKQTSSTGLQSAKIRHWLLNCTCGDTTATKVPRSNEHSILAVAAFNMLDECFQYLALASQGLIWQVRRLVVLQKVLSLAPAWNVRADHA